jgi:hypothetical protein
VTVRDLSRSEPLKESQQNRCSVRLAELQYRVDDFAVKLCTLNELVRCGGNLLRPCDQSFTATTSMVLPAGAVGEIAQNLS